MHSLTNRSVYLLLQTECSLCCSAVSGELQKALKVQLTSTAVIQSARHTHSTNFEYV